MPIDSQHLQYRAMAPRWKQLRDTFEGEYALKAEGARYLRPLPGMNQAEYLAYLDRGSFPGWVSRTTFGLSGITTSKPAEIDVPHAVDLDLADVTLSGVRFETLVKRILGEVLLIGRCACVIDWSDSERRPYWALQLAESVTNWKAITIGGRKVLTMVVLKEEATLPGGDPFEESATVRYRSYELVDGFLVVRVWQQEKTGRPFEVVDVLEPMNRGQRLTSIPIVFFTPEAGSEPDVVKSPLEDLSNLSLTHWRLITDHYHALHWSACPTAVVIGENVTGSLHVGSSRAWTLPSKDAKVLMLEVAGNGYAGQRNAILDVRSQAAVAGGRLLESQMPSAESAAAKRLRQAGDSSLLSSICDAVDDSITRGLRLHAMWRGDDRPDAVTFKLNRDFFDQPLSAGEASALLALWLSSAISHDTLFANLKAADIARAGTTAEDERAAIRAEGSQGMSYVALSSTGVALAITVDAENLHESVIRELGETLVTPVGRLVAEIEAIKASGDYTAAGRQKAIEKVQARADEILESQRQRINGYGGRITQLETMLYPQRRPRGPITDVKDPNGVSAAIRDDRHRAKVREDLARLQTEHELVPVVLDRLDDETFVTAAWPRLREQNNRDEIERAQRDAAPKVAAELEGLQVERSRHQHFLRCAEEDIRQAARLETSWSGVADGTV